MRERPFTKLLIGIITSATLLSLCSAFQKASLNVNIFKLEGYIVPFLFGSFTGGIIGLLNYKWRSNLREKLRLEKILSKELDSQVKNKTKNILIANEMLELLMDTLTHDILNYLTIIDGNLNIYLGNPKQRFLEEIDKATEKGIKLVENIRKFDQLVDYNQELKLIEIASIIRDLQDDYDLKINVKGNAIVLADDLLKTVFDNLIRNVKEHTESDYVEIQIQEENEKFCSILFRDHGKGIPDNLKNSLFERGNQGKDSKYKGLGLYIVKKIIERYGGTIKLVESPQGGTSFSIKLPKE
ncbi:MAG: GHKL domain-containing protein [Candidatus Lokiarchaeota archaeon]|nr:GHKL domain-containing protein [Candidatus Lokiarchaeota archaeon]MBD3201161.1 GHKL domain-containing protein [Candidatus Lokiarchaeota archaeon]